MGKLYYETHGKKGFVINMMNLHGVTVYKPVEKNGNCYFYIKACDSVKANDAFYKCGKEYKILRDGSSLNLVKRLCKRIGIFSGLAICVLVIALWTVNVTEVRIDGTEYTSEEQIMDTINSVSKIPIKKSEIDLKKIETAIISLDGIGNASLEIKGNVLYVEILEELYPPEVVDYNDKSDMVSNYDAIVTDVVTLSGEAMVKSGDTVKKGDILISHIKELDDGNILESKPLGTIKGRTWISKEYVFTPEIIVKERTGNKRVWFSTKKSKAKPKIGFEMYECEEERIFYAGLFPFTLKKYTAYEVVNRKRKFDFQSQKDDIIEKKIREIEESLPKDCEKVKYWCTEKTVDKNTVLVIYYEIIVNLAE